jgi:sulfatase maturation enzyme AslB (radical SAM superfamily)
MIKDRNTVVLYSSATCNLNCIYCAIDKNPALVKIDNLLEESFSGDYYINFIKEIFPDTRQLKRIEIWGGETFLSIERIYPTIENIFKLYPNCDSFFVSTNFTIDDWIDKFHGLIKTFNNTGRAINFHLQLSIDGPKYITDAQRGDGVTDKFNKNFDKLMDYISKVNLKNVSLTLSFKPTLTINYIKKINDHSEILEYYQFFEKYYEKFSNIDIKNNKINFYHAIPNMAVPGNYTQEDGRLFKEFTQKCFEVNKENKESKILKYYKDILMFSSHTTCSNNCISCGMCGGGFSTIGVLPNRMISVCHNGFSSFLSQYKELARNNSNYIIDQSIFNNSLDEKMIFPFDKLRDYEFQTEAYYRENSKFNIANLSTLIIMLAKCGQIDCKYINEDEAVRGAKYLLYSGANCVRDNLVVNGTMALQPISQIKLLLNGARDYLDFNTYKGEYDGI